MSYDRLLNVGFAACLLISLMVIANVAVMGLLGETMPRVAVGLCVVIAILSVFGLKVRN